MKSSIFIPKRINVGYQERYGTYTGKLAYVIYYDEKGKLRKEKSWNGWRNKDIPNDEFENDPIDGFVLNKKVGDCESGWNHRHAYCRVYDPRGFEFEITIENLLFILENTNYIKGKGLEGSFVYGWSGTDLVLLPVDSPDYKEITEYNQILYENNFIKAKDLKIGAIYVDNKNCEYTYIGRFDYYDYGYWKNGIFFKTYNSMVEYCKKNNVPRTIQKTYSAKREVYKEDKYAYGNYGKRHCFYYREINSNLVEFTGFIWKSSLSKFLTGVIDDNPNEKYSYHYERLEHNPHYSPIDESKSVYCDMTYEDFVKRASNYTKTFFSDINGVINNYYVQTTSNRDLYIVKVTDHDSEVLDIFPTKEFHRIGYGNIKEKRMIPVTLKEIFEKMKPKYKHVYLENGNPYSKQYY